MEKVLHSNKFEELKHDEVYTIVGGVPPESIVATLYFVFRVSYKIGNVIGKPIAKKIQQRVLYCHTR